VTDLALAPSRIPAFKRLWSDSGTDPRLMAVGAAARGAWTVILAGADAEGVFRREGTVSALDILADRLGEDLGAARTCIALLVREGLVAEVPEGFALPREAFVRRQPELYAPDIEPAPARPSERPQGRGVAPTRGAPVARRGVTGAKGGRPTLGTAPMTQAERDDRRRFRTGVGVFRGRLPGQSFEDWLATTDEGHALAARRRLSTPTYGCAGVHETSGVSTKLLHETVHETSAGGFVDTPSPSHTLPLPREEKADAADAGTHERGVHETSGVSTKLLRENPAGGFVDTDDDQELPVPPPRALPAETRRAIVAADLAAARAFLDAVNAPERVNGLLRGREVVYGEFAASPGEVKSLGCALVAAGATEGTELFARLVNALRDRAVFAKMYAGRSIAARGQITVRDLVRQDAFALSQALNECLGAMPGRTLILAPKTGANGRRGARQSVEVREDACVPSTDGDVTAQRVSLG
jgi:hypothetical protein